MNASHRQVLHGLVLLALAPALLLAGCSRSESQPAAPEPPATRTAQEDGRYRLQVTARAAERLALETTPVTARVIGGAERLTVPYAAVVYETDGSTWTYTNPEPHVFIRQRLEVDSVDGGVAVLRLGPPSGVLVVVAGAAELYGIEFGVKK